MNRKNKIEKREVCISLKNKKTTNKHLKNTNNKEDNNSLKKLQRELFEHIEQEVWYPLFCIEQPNGSSPS